MKTDFTEIKRTTDIVAVVQSRGVELKREGKDWRGRCPFHPDEGRPNLIVTQDKGLFHCPACGAAGNVIQFVARIENLTEREAALKLLGAVPGVSVASAMLPAAIPPLVVPPEVAAKLLSRVAGYYAKALHKSRVALDYLKSRGLDDPTLLETFAVGYCDGSLRQTLPESGEVVEQLKALGVLNDKGNETLYLRVVVPIYNATGDVVSLYGRRTNDEEPRHLHMKGERHGVFNGQAAKAHKCLIVVESIFDAMSLWVAGFRNAIALYGKDGWTKDHTALVRDNGIKEIYLALDNDAAGRAGTERLLPILTELGIKTYRVTWPDGVKDANAFFSSRCAEDFAELLKVANPPQPQDEGMEVTADGFSIVYSSDVGSRRYELCGVDKPSPSRLKATVRAIVPGAQRFVIDTLDFYMLRSKRGFISEAARLFKHSVETIEADVNRLTIAAESFVTQRSAGALPMVDTAGSDADRAEGLRLGRSSDLLGQVRKDLAAIGLVGEEVNKLLLYVAMTSRKTDKPISVQVLSGSGAGKSHMQDAVLSLCPEEDLIKVTALTDRALFYKGVDALKHKVLAIEEVAGAEGADYAIRNLISSGKLAIESTIKNPLTGRLETQTSTVNGPAAVFRTTTKPDADAETQSRFVITSVDESAAQTRRIIDAQRQSHTLEGLRRKHLCASVEKRHHAFQRLLRAIPVVNPYEPLLTYGDDRLLFRRDNPKYQQLIVAVTFLHQLQRPIKRDDLIGEYIETTLEDIAIANELAVELLGRSLDDVSPPSRELLGLIVEYLERRALEDKDKLTENEPAAMKQARSEFSRRELREALKWSEYQLRTHLRQLVDMEYLVPVSGRQGALYSYRLVYQRQEKAGFVPGMKSADQLREEAAALGIGETSRAKNELRGLKTNFEGTSRAVSLEVEPTAKPHQYSNGVVMPTTSRADQGKRIYVLRKENGVSLLKPATG